MRVPSVGAVKEDGLPASPVDRDPLRNQCPSVPGGVLTLEPAPPTGTQSTAIALRGCSLFPPSYPCTRKRQCRFYSGLRPALPPPHDRARRSAVRGPPCGISRPKQPTALVGDPDSRPLRPRLPYYRRETGGSLQEGNARKFISGSSGRRKRILLLPFWDPDCCRNMTFLCQICHVWPSK